MDRRAITYIIINKKNRAVIYYSIEAKYRDSRYLVGIGIYFGKSKKKETFIYNSS